METPANTAETALTLEALEALVGRMEADDAAERTRLGRLISVFARILHLREPQAFSRRALEYSDEDGHFDNSYPPKQRYKDRNGPLSVLIDSGEFDQIATTGGFYYEWRAATSTPGLAIGADGRLYVAEFSGEGRVGQFAAHPGDAGVMVEVDWIVSATTDLALAALRQAEAVMRAKAFPLVAAARER